MRKKSAKKNKTEKNQNIESKIFDSEENNDPIEIDEVDEVEAMTAGPSMEEMAESVEGANENLKEDFDELSGFETAQIEMKEELSFERILSIVESTLFASHKPVSLAFLKETLKDSGVEADQIKQALEVLRDKYTETESGVNLEHVPGGYQLRTKVQNTPYLSKTLKARIFRLSGPALEVLSIVAYKQPLIKAEIDQIRGVESGHLLRALMEKGLVTFDGKSELPGRPMLYATTKKFLELFNLRSVQELPSLSQIDEILPEGISDEDVLEKSKLSDLTEGLSEAVKTVYSENEEELENITEELKNISTHFEFKTEEENKLEAEKTESETTSPAGSLAGSLAASPTASPAASPTNDPEAQS